MSIVARRILLVPNECLIMRADACDRRMRNLVGPVKCPLGDFDNEWCVRECECLKVGGVLQKNVVVSAHRWLGM